ncbi:ABC transporter substrate-binding protein [Hoeflea ulvae]|uniref:ABC transporter substrate-binding protein n=1 Tax=Hoeflea ulvae TaxID=2983764 RepID=A0ABT3YE81_9HYPH|nr:ABC transporter substrate-binding protein [Hoeflea ulvae]MCY0094208.1 ABC transporter substrate-binding protein [Hoeflea ulvae]
MKFALYGAVAMATAMTAFAPAVAAAQELVLSIGSRGYGGMVERNIEAFEAANPDTSVEWLKVSDVPGDSRKLYVTGLTAKSPTPDVFAIDVIWAGEFAQRGWLEPLNDYLGEETIAAYNPSFLSAATVEDKVFAAPLYVDGTHLFYRSDLLEKYGIAVPKTWEEVISASKIVMEGEGNPQLYGFVSMWAKIEGLFMNWLSFINGNGASFFDADGNVAVNSPEAIAATQTMVDMLYEDRIVPDSILTMRPDDARTLFQQGRAVFLMVQDFVHAPLSAEDSPVAGKFDFTRNPYFEGHEDAHSTAMGGWLLAVNANSEHKEEAAKLVEYFTSYAAQLAAAIDENRAPGRTDVYAAPEMTEAALIQKFGEDYAVGVVRPSAITGSLYPRVSEVMQTEVTNALHRQKTVEEALNDAAAEVNSILGK